MTIQLAGSGLTIEDVVGVARQGTRVAIKDSARQRMVASRAIVEGLADGEPTYGITTGFGALETVAIPADKRAALQVALVRSHAAGAGPRIESEVIRAMMVLRARTLAMGFSGARPETAEALVALLNGAITPLVYEHGSLGASGDLAPLAHVALALIGEGEVEHGGEVVAAAEALAAAGLAPIELVEKEGLALTNGTDGILGMLCLAAADISNLLKAADVVAAMSVEGLLGTDRAFADDLVALRPQPGQARSAANLRKMLAGSPLVASHRHDDPRVQDAYSLRCTPQVHGAGRDTLDHLVRTVGYELEAAIDNPMVLEDGRVESGGNFHGAPLGYVADFAAIALADLGSVSERRMDRLLDTNRSHGLPAFLGDDPGVDSGLMIAHYTAAAMCGENRLLAAPASVDTFATSGMQEDHVSMAWGAARKLRTVVANVSRILAIELMAAARAIELRAPVDPAPATAAVIKKLRTEVAGPGPDRALSPEIAAAEVLVADGSVVEAASGVAGSLD